MKITVEFKAATIDDVAFQTLVGIQRAIDSSEQDRTVLQGLLSPTVYNTDEVIDAIIATKGYKGEIVVDCDKWSYIAGFTLTK